MQSGTAVKYEKRLLADRFDLQVTLFLLYSKILRISYQL